MTILRGAASASALLALLAGCDTAPKRVYLPAPVSAWVVRGTRGQVGESCAAVKEHDDGEPCDGGHRHPACWLPEPREIWLSWDRPEDLLHELGHLVGLPRGYVETALGWFQ